MPKLINTIWITAFTLFAMLSTSVVASANASNNILKIAQQSSVAEDHQELSLHLNCPEQELDQHKVEPHCSSSSCLLKMSSLRSIEGNVKQTQSLALISDEPISKPILRTQLLYRPPIS
ncbi:hypothetical protein L4C33_11205 [Vibrio makurazakiensis]|uniref:hypothetical protein n=1 Tax=Vibrio makurazakiensis TaxID=2910250 RepID=UPI003D0A1CA8